MQGSDELYPPVQYGGGWAFLAILAILGVAALIWIIVVLTRQRRMQTNAAPTPAWVTGDALVMLRQEYNDKITAIEQDYRKGVIDARHANLYLSRTVRGFVNEYSGLEAPVLSLSDLVRLGVQRPLVDAIQRSYYPSIFRREPGVDPAQGAAAARQVVAQWY